VQRNPATGEETEPGETEIFSAASDVDDCGRTRVADVCTAAGGVGHGADVIERRLLGFRV
jgi:hypothetical protein